MTTDSNTKIFNVRHASTETTARFLEPLNHSLRIEMAEEEYASEKRFAHLPTIRTGWCAKRSPAIVRHHATCWTGSPMTTWTRCAGARRRTLHTHGDLGKNRSRRQTRHVRVRRPQSFRDR